MKAKTHIIIFFLLFASNIAFSLSDTLLVRDLSRDWVYYDKSDEEFFPLVDKTVFKGNTIFFSLNLEDYGNTILHISSQGQPVSLFIENKLMDIVEGGEIALPTKEIASKFNLSEIRITIYSTKLNPFKLQTRLVDIAEETVNPLGQENIIVLPRSKSEFNNFFLIGCAILGVFLASLFNFYPRVLSDFFKITKAINPREVEENLIKSRPLSQINLLFYFFISLLIGLFLIGVINFGDFKYSVSFFRPTNVLDGLSKWLQTSLVLFLWIIVKLSIIHYFSRLYRINSFLNTHFFNYMRLSFLLFSLGMAALVCSQYIFLINEARHYSFLLGLLFIVMGINILVIYLKLINAVSSKKLHLFSYLCGTELIPFGIILSLGINQTF